MSGTHFEQMADAYAAARPPYPAALYDALVAEGAAGPGVRALEVGAGSGLATAELVRRGTDIVALEPGARLAALLREAVPGTEVLVSRLEDAVFPRAGFDAVVAATAMHWVDLDAVLPTLHDALRPGGRLAVWRNVFGDDAVRTAFRDRVGEIVARRRGPDDAPAREARPTMAELGAGGWFEPVRTERWRWSVELTGGQVRGLFRTFSDWTADEAEEAGAAADELGGRVTEHYRSVLHLLRRRDR
ncbi:class I SAM-dependent methyltransferase [Isoptericola sp. NPDC057559]|uniref:class I SAM-dependent methyltransferase n=1 Tax=Isoptericola sp. NPDC057559 TaxID=3346168 RepID=UPI0036B49971